MTGVRGKHNGRKISVSGNGPRKHFIVFSNDVYSPRQGYSHENSQI